MVQNKGKIILKKAASQCKVTMQRIWNTFLELISSSEITSNYDLDIFITLNNTFCLEIDLRNFVICCVCCALVVSLNFHG